MRCKNLWNKLRRSWLRYRPSPFALLALLCVVYSITLGGASPDAQGWNASPITIALLPGMGGPGADSGAEPSTSDATAETKTDAGTGAAANGKTAAEATTPSEPEKKLIEQHVVQPGETLSVIAEKYGTDVDTIAGINNLSSVHKLSVGQKLKVLTIKGALHVVQRGESLWDIARSYKVDVDKIVAVNKLADPEKLQLQQELVIPGAQQRSVSTSSSPRTIISASGKLQRAFSWPVRGRISSYFGKRWGRMHEGLDIAVPTGTPVRAAAAGKVTFAGYSGGYGYLVKVSHGNGVETRYGHNSAILVKVGQQVDAEQVLARSGNTGNSTGPHVHFEIRLNGKAVNPYSYLK